MKRIITMLLLAALLITAVSCALSDTETNSQTPEEPSSESQPAASDTVQESSPDSETPTATGTGSEILVVYFSRTGEQYSVGVIDEGNTAIVAKMIAEKTGADTFEVLPETDYYPYTYKELTDVAKKEQSDKARPKIKGVLPDVSNYDTIFIGAPVWWGDWPMIMYTFFENVDLSGKKLVPFSTHEGSGLSGFDRKLASAVPGAIVLTGQAFRGSDCQNKQADVKNTVNKWIDSVIE